ncbi:MAG: DUF7289 family protein [archaeon]
MQGQGDRSQSETLGVVLLLGMTVLSVGALAAFGGAAIDGTEQTVDLQSAEHALSQLDSKASLVALSDAERQSVSLGRARQGTYSVDPDRGHITVEHVNYNNENDTQVLYDAPLGAVRYENGETTLAYQGGGVWRAQRGGGSVMVSSPEFHYRSMTLTLPVIRLSGDGSIAGSAAADVYSDAPANPVYPNTSATYDNSSRQYLNPVQNGTVEIAVQSEFYQAWGNYFETRTDGKVTTYDENETAVLELVSTGAYGDFDVPMEGTPLELRALNDNHPLTDFTVTIAPDDRDSADFSDLSWSLWAKEGSKKFEVNLQAEGNADDGSDVAATVYYSNGTAEQGWHADDVFVVTENEAGEARIEANLTSDASLTYQDVGSNDLVEFKGNDDFAESVTFDEHDADAGQTYEGGDNASIGYVVNHYISMFGSNVDLEVEDGNSDGGGASGGVNEDASTGHLQVDDTGEYVTYVHLSENNVTVDLR